TTIPNQSYHVKLVIADEHNYRYDSAVFLEAGSFELNTNLGPDKVLVNNNPACENETVILNAYESGTPTYKWFKDGVELTTETNATYEVTTPGVYSVEVTLDTGCISTGSIEIEYVRNPVVNNTTLIACDLDQNGLITYNLFDANQGITNNDPELSIDTFYTSLTDAHDETEAIPNPSSYSNCSPQPVVYATGYSQNTSCSSIAEVTLDISTYTLNIDEFDTCDDGDIDGFTGFDLDAI